MNIMKVLCCVVVITVLNYCTHKMILPFEKNIIVEQVKSYLEKQKLYTLF